MNSQFNLDPDRIQSANPIQVRDAAVSIMVNLQDKRPEEQALGAAVYFILMCQRYRQPAKRVLESADMMMKKAGMKDAAHYEGITMFLDNER